jgi:pantoate--beta-alanine ligase
VVLKLFHCVFNGGAGVAVFGQKDYQQQLILKHMVQQLAMPIDIVTAATTRAPDGLALSSRNGYLSPPERAEAVQLSVALNSVAQAVRAAKAAGLFDVHAAEKNAMQALVSRGWQPDYITLRHRHDLSAVTALGEQAMVVLGAAKLGKTRLIDNVEI